jgi:cytochrome c biogenesis protein CcdA
MALGVVTLQGHTLWGVAILATFAVGWSLPLAAGLVGLGLGLGKLTSALQKAAPIVKTAGGIVLIGAGFYLLGTA